MSIKRMRFQQSNIIVIKDYILFRALSKTLAEYKRAESYDMQRMKYMIENAIKRLLVKV